MKKKWGTFGRKTGKILWPYVVLGLLGFICCYMMAGRQGLFATEVDWFSQHSVFPEYFRQQFLETGQLFPEFAPNIGGGQNIYYFAYYGLLSPVVLVSYLFPFISMEIWIMGASFACLEASVLLLFYWLEKRGFSRCIAFFTALLFLLAGPMIYHSCKQIMFVNYMPFLCLALIGVDRYFEKRKATLLTVGVFLMIMSSFYFSVGGILAVVLYGVHRYVQIKEDGKSSIRIKTFFKEGIFFLRPIFTAVLMSGVLLIPTALTLGGRSGGGQNTAYSLKSLFIPEIRPLGLFYSPYGLGLTTLILTVLITGFFYGFSLFGDSRKKRQERVLAWGCGILLLFPLFCWLLNGGLYMRDKAFISFLPLICYLIAWYVRKLSNQELSFLAGFLPYLLTLGILLLNRESLGRTVEIDWLRGNVTVQFYQLLLGEGLVLLGAYLFFWRRKRSLILLLPSVCILFLFGNTVYQISGELLDKAFYEKITQEEIGVLTEAFLSEETGFYRMEQVGTGRENSANLNRIWNQKQYISSIYASTYNAAYHEFRQETFGVEMPFRNFLMQSVSQNPIFQKIMGVKYIVSEKKLPGYNELKEAPESGAKTGKEEKTENQNINVYENDWAAPVLYATDRVISEKAYKTLSFPYNQTALAEYAVVEEDERNTAWKEHLAEETRAVSLVFPELKKTGNSMEKTEKGLRFKIKESEKMEISLSESSLSETLIGGDAKTGELKDQNLRVLYLQFQVNNKKPSQDMKIRINGIQNKLTAKTHDYYNENTLFTYGVALEKGATSIIMELGEGDYEITGLSCYEGKSCTGWRTLYQSPVEMDWKATKGNRLQGTVSVETDGFLISSIPFEKDFEIRIDGKTAAIRKVNTAFLGCAISAGEHKIEITYHAPGAKAGKMCSLFGFWVAAFWLLLENKTGKREKNRIETKKTE